jgi:hypothetical protein
VQIDECETKEKREQYSSMSIGRNKKNTNKATMDMFEENKTQMC